MTDVILAFWHPWAALAKLGLSLPSDLATQVSEWID